MRLHSDYPWWMISEGIQHSYPTLRHDLRTDVAIIGAGITGALVAQALCAAGLEVAVVDKRHVAHGSTSANTALLQYEIDTPLFMLERMLGKARARRAYTLCGEALTQLASLCGTLGDVEFEARPSLLYASWKKHVPEILRPEFAARQAAGFDVRWLDAADVRSLFGFTAPGAILSRQGGQVNPYRLARVLLERSVAAGAQVYESSTIAEISAGNREVRLGTADGCTITARYVVVAAGYEAQPFLPITLGKIHSTFAVISKPLPMQEPWHRNALLWETRRPYLYFRTTADGRIIIGGRDAPFHSVAARDGALRRKSRELLADFRKQFPHIPFDPDFWWAGTFTDTPDGLPYIGPCTDKRVLYALGYGGNGITFSTIAAGLLRDRILGRENPDADLFGFARGASAGSRAAGSPAPAVPATGPLRAAPSARLRAR